MSIEISGDLQSAAEEFDEIERRNNLYIRDTLNDFGYRKLFEQAESVENSLESAEPETEFDELILRDMKYSLEATTEFADFLRRDSDLQTEEMFDLLYGNEAFANLRKEALSYDDEANYKARELRDKLTFDNEWKYKFDIEEIAHDISSEIEEWAKEEGLMPEDFKFEIQMIPQGTTQRANWRGSINQMNVPVENGVYVIRNGGEEPVYDATNAIFTQFHELVGHGVHQQNSRSIAFPQYTDGPTYRPSSVAHCEGVAQHREQIAEEFIEAKRDELPVMDIGMQLRKMSEENKDSRMLYTRFVREMQIRDEISDEEAEEMVAEVYKPEIADKALQGSSMPTFKAFKEGSYSAGLKLMDDVDADNQPSESVTIGQWSPEVFPDVVEYLN